MALDIYKSSSPSILEVLKKVIVFNASSHLWFFHILFSFYLLYPMIRKVYDYFVIRSEIKKLIIIAIVLQLSWAIGDIVLPRDLKIISIALFATKFLGWIAYFILGMLACSCKEILIKAVNTNISRIVSTIIASVLIISIIWVDVYFGAKNVILRISGTALDLILFSAIIALLLLVSTKLDRTNSALKKALLCIGNYSFGIYLVHIVHMRLFNKFIAPMMNVNPSSWLFYLSLFFFMLGMSTITVDIISKLPFHHLVIGKVSRMILNTDRSNSPYFEKSS
jgi:surface polysaccharide O-acyltransferase-like enzyme